jgi:hypothetical protein
MDGFRLFDTYKRYKTGQNKFTTWLKQTAEKCGYSYASDREFKNGSGNRSSKSQSKARKDVPSGTVVRMAEFAGLAKAIVARTENIPGSIIQMLKDVIVQRKKASDHYKIRSGYEPKKDDGHEHIIQVLEDVMKIFEGVTSKSKAEKGYVILVSYLIQIT